MKIKNSTIIRSIASCFVCAVLAVLPASKISASNAPSDAYTTTVTYVETFYPLWFTYRQASHGNNSFIGPERVSPLYHVVVAINDDTVYCSSYLDLTNEPVIMTIPSTVSPDTCSDDTSVTYSILTLDAYCDVIDTDIPHGAPPIAGGTYAFTGPGWTGTLPPGVIQVPMPVNFPTLIFRIDRYHAFTDANYENQIHQAELLRLSLRIQTLSDYLDCLAAGRTQILPELAFAIPYKTLADAEIANDPIAFLHELQTAVASPRTLPLSSGRAGAIGPFQRAIRQRTFWKALGFRSGCSGSSLRDREQLPHACGPEQSGQLLGPFHQYW